MADSAEPVRRAAACATRSVESRKRARPSSASGSSGWASMMQNFQGRGEVVRRVDIERAAGAFELDALEGQVELSLRTVATSVDGFQREQPGTAQRGECPRCEHFPDAVELEGTEDG